MLCKLFSSIFQSILMPFLPSLPEFQESPPEFPPSLPSPPEFLGPRDVDVVDTTSSLPTDVLLEMFRDVDVVDTTSSLPTDVLLEIFRRLEEPTDVIRCAAVCKTWRRAIIGNATTLRPRCHRFDPRLLLGVFHFSKYQARLRRTPGPFQAALPSNGEGCLGGYETAGSLIPDTSAVAGGFVNYRGLYTELLWSTDGFILLMARTVNKLCLFNPMTGDCTFLPGAAASWYSEYVLLTAHDDDASPACARNKLAVRILAVQKRDRFMSSNEAEEAHGLSYQVLFTSGAGAGVWGPVQHSGGDASEVEAEQDGLCVWMERRGSVVCRDAVYWLAGPSVLSITCTLALDVRTGRTWTTELPQRYRLNSPTYSDSLVPMGVPILATSGDGRLSLMESLQGPRIQVWVMLDGSDDDDNGARWTLQQTIEIDDMSNLLPRRWLEPDDRIATLIREMMKEDLSLIAFCPRSGCVVGVCFGMEFLIDVHSGSPTRARRIGEWRGHDCHPYEMDCWLTYISKMKHF